MAISDLYATVAEYRASIRKNDSADDPTLAAHLNACSRVFERETGQFFTKDAAAVVRLFRPKYSDMLFLDYEGNCPGIASTAGLEIKVDTDGDASFADETAWASTDYELLPRQAALGPEAKPYDRIKTLTSGSNSFIPGGLVQVTAIFGWPSVPAAVKADVIELCGIWRGENPRATGRMNELDEVLASSPMAMSLVKRFRDAYQARVAF